MSPSLRGGGHWYDCIPGSDPDPLLKWAGSKRAIRQSLAWHMPRDFHAYHEPFFGSGALFAFLRSKGWAGPAHLSDINRELMEFHAQVAVAHRALHERIRYWCDRHEREPNAYSLARSAWNDMRQTWAATERAAVFWYLNHACFNGLWRVNQRGDFNVPSASKKRMPCPTLERVAAVSERFANAATYGGQSFVMAVSNVGDGDFVYFDPPYFPTSATSNFTSYSVDGFNIEDHRMLAECARECVDRGARVMVSNSDMPDVRDLYAGFRIFEINAPRKIAANGSRRANASELIILGGY